MTGTTDLAVSDGQYREIATVEAKEPEWVHGLVPASILLDAFRPIPIPEDWTREDDDGNEVPYFVKRKALTAKTPPTQQKVHFKGYKYVEVDYVKRRLNEYADNGRWTFLVTKRDEGREYTQVTNKGESKKYQEVIVGGYILAPGILPTYGEGSAPYALTDQGDPRFFKPTAFNSAESAALKNAAKKLGIGADLREDEEVSKVISGQQGVIDKFFAALVADVDGKPNPKKADAVKLVARLAPQAFNGESLDAGRITEEQLDELLEKITDLYNK